VHAFHCPQRAPNRTSKFLYSLTFTASSLPSLPPTAGEASASLSAVAAATVVAMVMMLKPRTKRYF